mmetsp:Transcript_19807/g.47996  ORF Transcript_19807/g.47996 Transcript_19807/m.47996 type:complete len:248 (-) Transcript_19807:65-808(-)
MLAWRERPCVSSLTRFSRNGVTAAPATFCAATSPNACVMAASTTAPLAASPSGMGTPTTIPPGSPRASRAIITCATSSGFSTRAWGGQPESAVKKAGNESALYARVATEWVSRNSRVRGMSRIDFTPAHTTVRGVRASSVRSADTSPLFSTPRCTPPMPPVTKTRMPAMCASHIVPDTVVAPLPPFAMTSGRSRAPVFFALWPRRATRSRSASLHPMWTRPSRIAIVAGTAPRVRTAASTARAVSRF